MLAKEFKTLVLPLSSKLHRFALQFTKNEEEAQDVIQDVFLKLWQKRSKLYQVENIEAFAMRMTRNKCYDLHRGNRTYSLEEQQTNWQYEKKADLNDELELSETASMIRKLVMNLPKLQQQVMQMRDIEQLTYDEIEAILDLNRNAIRVNLSRARKTVRNELLKQLGYGIERDQTNTAKIFRG